MNKPVYLVLLILEISKILISEIWHEYVKLKDQERALCYMDADDFIIYIQTENFYAIIAKDVETRFNASSYELDGSVAPRKKERK